MAFRGVDYFLVDSLFSEQELMVRQTARRFVDERIAPLIRDCYRDARFPTELIPEMADIMRSLGCVRAVALDGGLSSQLLVRDTLGASHAWRGWRPVPIGLFAMRR